MKHVQSLALALCLVGLTFNFTGYPLLDPDEGRNAEVAREMAATGDYVLPRLNGLPYLDKPALYFVAGALSMKILGPTVLAARLPSLLFTVATLALVGWFGARLFGRPAGWTAVAATAATPFTLAYARTVIFDSALTFFVVLAIASFYLAVEPAPEAPNDGASRLSKAQGWAALAWVATGFGVLTKGPIALALPLMVAVPYAATRRSTRRVFDLLGVILFVAIVGPWVVLVSLQVPDFLHYALVTETLTRLTTDRLGRTGPPWYFIAIFPAATLPWSLVAAGGLWRAVRSRARITADRRFVFLLLWIAIPLLFFSLSQSKRPQYVLPLVPALGLFVAGCWRNGGDRLPGTGLVAAGLGTLGLAIVALRGRIADLVDATAPVARTIPVTAMALGLTCLATAGAVWLARRQRNWLLLVLCVPVAAIPLISRQLMVEIGRDRSAAELASAIRDVGGASTQVIGVRAFPLSLPFYLSRTIQVSTADGTELTSNYLVSRFATFSGFGSPLREVDWWREALIMCDRPRVFVVRSDDREARSFIEERLDMLIDTGRYAAFGPCGTTELALAP